MERTLWAAMQGPARAARWPTGPTPSWRRRSSTRSPGGCSARWAWTRPSSISIPTPAAAAGCAPPRSTERYARRRRSTARCSAGILQSYPVVGAVRPARARRGRWWPRLIAARACGETGLAGPIDHRDAPPGVLPEQGRLPGRPDPGRRRLILPLVLPLIHAERGIVVDAVLMTQNEASVVFGFSWTLLPGGRAPAAGAGRVPRARSCRSSAWTSSTPPSATTSTARPSSTAA